MKKSILFAIFATIVMGLNNVKAQTSCPVILNQTFRFIVNQSNPCTKSITFDFYNTTSGNKRIKVIVKVSNVEVVNDCVDASGQINVQRTYTSANFTACSYADVVVMVTPFTGTNCLGGACGATLSSTNGSPLPVTFGAFTATKNNSLVVLKWETLTEINNSGFAIERNTNGTTWEQVGFVRSATTDGNSTSKLTYQYNDINTAKGISQYRIRQIDINGNFKYSEIRAVRGDDQISKTTVFPNPSIDGKVTVLYSDASQRDITLFDMTGRAVKQWRAYSSNTITVENLVPGMYNLRSITAENGAQSTEKIVVSR